LTVFSLQTAAPKQTRARSSWRGNGESSQNEADASEIHRPFVDAVFLDATLANDVGVGNASGERFISSPKSEDSFRVAKERYPGGVREAFGPRNCRRHCLETDSGPERGRHAISRSNSFGNCATSPTKLTSLLVLEMKFRPAFGEPRPHVLFRTRGDSSRLS
jgi:hypothetical protein